MRRQAPLIEAADLIEAAAAQGDGFTSVELGDEAVILHWKGKLSRDASAAVDTARLKVRVEVMPAPHSKKELDAAEKRISQELTRGSGPDFSMQVAADGSGIVRTKAMSTSPSVGCRSSASPST